MGGGPRLSTVKQAIRQRALELGFDACHFTSSMAPGSGPCFDQWLAQGQHGEMAYLQRSADKRKDPQLVLPGAKSIIILAANYATVGDSPADKKVGALLARVARYAQALDYHHVLGGRLEELARWIDEANGPPTRSLWYVDTGPILERDLAQRSGIGFVGKHTNLISRRYGNWIFLAEILTTLELTPDLPEKNRCGSCIRCLKACPTQAIRAPFQLDARRCISYLTIELKGPIPLEFRPAIGQRIFGCDDCLEVCPWNRFAQSGKFMRDHSRSDFAALDLLALLALDEPAFKRHFAGTPIQRLKRRGLLRNVCVALGNRGEARALPALTRAAEDAEPLIAEHARWAIEQITARSTTDAR